MAAEEGQAKILRVVEYDNQDIVVGKYPFLYEDPNTPELAELRENYQLERVVGGGSEFERQVALRCWRATRFVHGIHRPEGMKVNRRMAWNALAYLEAAEQGATFTCPVAAATYVQLCLAMGWQARLVEICQASKEWIPPVEGNVAHCVSEVWSNDYRKWVLMDPDGNVHYARDGVPVSALELHDAWVNHEAEAVEMVQGDPPFRTDGSQQSKTFDVKKEFEIFFRHRVMDYYEEIRTTMRNNHFSRPSYGRDNGTGFLPQVVWTDSSSLPMVMRTGRLRPHVFYSGRREDFEWTLNQAHIELESADDKDPFAITAMLRVNLSTVTPWFSHFEVRLDDGEWRRSAATFVIRLRKGVNRIQARPVNVMGIKGIVSTVAMERDDEEPEWRR
ncbi:MAG: hypothetical protein HY321_01515 [Armatimonadetes bacterium]|nr:hypothetical protein [Armatimonadota bacterium]